MPQPTQALPPYKPGPHTLLSARSAGVVYLAIIVLGLFGEMFARGSLLAGDAATTAGNILGAQGLWRLGIAGDLVMHVLDVPLIVFFYLLLKPVSHPLALLMAVFNTIQTSVLVINKLALVAVLSLLNAPGLTGVAAGPGSAAALAGVAIDLHSHGFGIGLIFFGFTCLVRGTLVFRSGYVPRALGVLLWLAGIGYIVNSFALLLSPALAALLFPAVLLPAFVAELAMSGWLLVTNQGALQRQLAATGARPASSS